MDTSIFKAYDVRGKVGTELIPEVTEKIGRAFGDWLPENGPVVVGYDMRPDSQELAAAVMDGLVKQGREVYKIGQVASDMLYFAVGSLGAAGGAMVTASHNPGEYNGIKFCREEARGVGIESGLADIRDAAAGEQFADVAEEAKVTEQDVMEAWVKHALSFVKPQEWPSYRFAVDAGNGMAGAVMPHLKDHLPENTEMIEMYWELDGSFPNHQANPLDPKNLEDVQAKIRQENLDFGIAFDGDGDRAVLVDETGEALTGAVMTAILARYFLENNPGATILYNANCSRVVPETIEKYGGKSIRTKVGHSYIKGNMRETDAVFAGEHSGHYYFRDNFSADSGLIAALVAVQVMAESGKKLSELAGDYKIYATIPETNFEVEDTDTAVAKLKEEFSDAEQNELDGLTVEYPDAWFIVRASNTEPLLRLNAEAETKERLDELVERVTKVIEA